MVDLREQGHPWAQIVRRWVLAFGCVVACADEPPAQSSGPESAQPTGGDPGAGSTGEANDAGGGPVAPEDPNVSTRDSGGGDAASEGGFLPSDCDLILDGVCHPVFLKEPEAVCSHWRSHYVDASDPLWRAGTEECDVGVLEAEAATSALSRINLYRWLVQAPAVSEREDWRPGTQACAVMQAFADRLDHFPDEEWPCWSALGSQTAAWSNLSIGQRSPASAVDGQIEDAGTDNAEALMHRRWLLHPALGEVGIGFARHLRGASCIKIQEGEPIENPRRGVEGITAFPPPGVVPLEVVAPSNHRQRQLRWSVTAADISLVGSVVSIYEERASGDVRVPTTFGPLRSALDDGIWIQPALSVAADRDYRVEVRGTSAGDLFYRVRFVDCGLVAPYPCDPVAQDCPLPGTACYGTDPPHCFERSYPLDGALCDVNGDCDTGYSCVLWDSAGPVCSRYCSTKPDASPESSCERLCEDGALEFMPTEGFAVCRP